MKPIGLKYRINGALHRLHFPAEQVAEARLRIQTLQDNGIEVKVTNMPKSPQIVGATTHDVLLWAEGLLKSHGFRKAREIARWRRVYIPNVPITKVFKEVP